MPMLPAPFIPEAEPEPLAVPDPEPEPEPPLPEIEPEPPEPLGVPEPDPEPVPVPEVPEPPEPSPEPEPDPVPVPEADPPELGVPGFMIPPVGAKWLSAICFPARSQTRTWVPVRVPATFEKNGVSPHPVRPLSFLHIEASRPSDKTVTTMLLSASGFA